MPSKINHSGFCTRASSVCGSLSCDMSTLRSSSISSCVRCFINNGLLLHLNVTFLPNGISLSLTSILANANTSADGATLATISCTIAFAQYAVATPTAIINKK